MSNSKLTSSSKLIPVEERPFNAEAPVGELAEPITPTSLFYVRNHFDVPRIDATTWRLTVDGAVGHPLALSLEDIQGLPETTEIVTLECAGNGRKQMSPVPPGTPWGYGAVSTASFTGTPLSAILEKAWLNADASEVLFIGADKGEVEPGRLEPFARSLSLDVASHADTLLAWAMNGKPLTPDHGFPLRVILPRWYGVASVKWLVRISALPSSFSGYFQKERYVYTGEQGTPDGTPVGLMRVRAVIAEPSDGAELPMGPLEIAGTAWSGSGKINRVQVSADEGHSWTDAKLSLAPSPYAATPWRFRWVPKSRGTYTLVVRATDTAGNAQPLEPVWNAHGYGNNVAHRVRITVR